MSGSNAKNLAEDVVRLVKQYVEARTKALEDRIKVLEGVRSTAVITDSAKSLSDLVGTALEGSKNCQYVSLESGLDGQTKLNIRNRDGQPSA